jgi:UDP-N-acetylmuramoylalanine--D-glutamate ligase
MHSNTCSRRSNHMRAGDKVVVLGLGREGIATLQFLRRTFPRIEVTVADRTSFDELGEAARRALDFNSGVNGVYGPDYMSALENADVVVRSPGISLRIPALQRFVARGGRVTSGTNLFFSHTKGTVLGVTGTKGKSTTSSLLAHLLSACNIDVRLVGNIGEPALTHLQENDESVTYVYELSSYQLEDFVGSLYLGVILNIYPEHLDYHGSLDAYYHAKLRLLTGLGPSSPLIYGSYCQPLADRIEALPGKHLPCPGSRTQIDDDYLLVDGKQIASLKDTKLIGRHNLRNVACAFEAALTLGCPIDGLVRGLMTFTPLPHRLESVGTFREIRFINDSIATTPEATIAALDAVDGPVGTLIAGGLDRGYSFQDLARRGLDRGVSTLIALPGSGSTIVKEIAGRTQVAPPAIYFASSMHEAVQLAYDHTPPGSICLLSCASPSYNLFKNFEDRGNQFAQEVRRRAMVPLENVSPDCHTSRCTPRVKQSG